MELNEERFERRGVGKFPSRLGTLFDVCVELFVGSNKHLNIRTSAAFVG